MSLQQIVDDLKEAVKSGDVSNELIGKALLEFAHSLRVHARVIEDLQKQAIQARQVN